MPRGHDQERVCKRCGTRFLYTAAEQERDGTPPACCPGCRALSRLAQRRRGVVKWFDRRKGYGFVRDDQDGDVFLHALALEGKAPRAGQVVDFVVRETDKGFAAAEVTIVED